MKKSSKLRTKLAEYPSGQTMAEYVLIVSAIAIVLLGGYETLGATLSRTIVAITAAL